MATNQNFATTFKRKTAASVLTLALILAVGYGSAYAKPNGLVGKEQTCFDVSNAAFRLVKMDEDKAIMNLNEILNTPTKDDKFPEESAAINKLFKELTYYGLNKKGTLEGDRLKQLIRAKCLSIHGNYFN